MLIFKYALAKKLWLFKAAAFLIILFYFLIIGFYSQNFPFWDDYVVTLQFFNDFYEAKTFAGKIDALLAQWYEHRIVMGRLLALCQFYISGILKFKVLHVVANLALFFLFLGILKSTKKEIRNWIFLPVALLLFQLQYYVASFWFVSSSSMFFVLAFAFFALYFLEHEKYALCVIFSIISLFSNGNGFLVFIIEIVFLLSFRKWKLSVVFLAIFLVLILVYFHDYTRHENDRMSTLYFLREPIRTIDYFLSFLGGCFNVFGLAPLVGLAGIGAFIWLTFNKFYNQNQTLYCMMWFVVGSALLADIGRSFWGVEQALESRYKIFSIVFWICLLLSFFELQKEDIRKQLFPWLLLSSFIFNIGSYYKSWPFMLRFLEAQRKDYLEVNSEIIRNNLNEASGIAVKSRARGYY